MTDQLRDKRIGPWTALLIGIAAIFGVGLVVSQVGEDGFAILFYFVGLPALFIFLVIRALVRVGNKRPPPVVIAPVTTASPPPGWYPDSQGVSRWFDGQRWTEFTQLPPNPES